MTLLWLAAITVLAGVVYGFAGFGAALIWMPLGAMAVSPASAVAILAVTSLGSVATVVPRAWREADRRAALTMLGAAIVCLPLGVAVLRVVEAEAMRWVVSGVVLATLAALVAGWRYRGRPGVPAWIGVGAAVGVCGGSTGLNGPPLVLFQLGGRDAAARSRANTILVLSLSSLALLPVMAVQGMVARGDLATGLILAPVYGAAAWAGQRLFTPARAGLYRRTAYVVVGAAGLGGLPIWG